MSTPWSEAVAVEIVTAHAGRRGPLMPVLHALLDEFGYVDPRAVPIVARILNLSRADVHGVITFYRDFRSTPVGAVDVRVCRAEACQSVGGHELAAHARRALGVELGETTADGSVTLDQVFCLGNCALGPSVTVNGRLYGRVAADDLDRLVSSAVNATGTDGP